MRNARVLPLFTVLIAFASACARETIAHQQNESQANRILVLLKGSEIDAEKVRDLESREIAFNVTVAKAQAPEALKILESHNLPEVPKKDTETMFAEGGLIPTKTQERAKREVGVAGDIMNRLRQVPRVIDVQALVSIPEDNPLRDPNEPKPRPKAAVIVSYLPNDDDQPPLTVEGVQAFVQASLSDLRPTEVSVAMIPASSANGKLAAPATGAGGAAAPIVMGGCETVQMMGIKLCKESKASFRNVLISIGLFAALLAGMAVVAVLRAMRYRKDLTRLTAQVAQLKR